MKTSGNSVQAAQCSIYCRAIAVFYRRRPHIGDKTVVSPFYRSFMIVVVQTA